MSRPSSIVQASSEPAFRWQAKHPAPDRAVGVMSVNQLSVSLGARPVLRGVDVTFQRGRVTALLGANGAGKSTLLACLAGLRKPDTGSVLIGGEDVTSMERQLRARRVGLLPQSGEVHWDLDVASLVALGRLPHRGRWAESEADARAVSRAMAAANIAHFSTRSAKQLSGGERSRVLLARVLAGEPEWLLADEPLASLDPAHQLEVLDRFREIAAAGAGVIVVLHDLTHAARVADDVVLMKEGRIVVSGEATEALGPGPLREAFGIDVHVGCAATGERFLIPLRRATGSAVRDCDE